MEPGGGGDVAAAAEEESRDDPSLTEEQKQRIHRNKEKALALRDLRKKSKPYDKVSERSSKQRQGGSSSVSLDKQSQPLRSARNTHAGFIMDDDEDAKKAHAYKKVEDAGIVSALAGY